MKRDCLGAATSDMAADPFISAAAVPVSLGPAVLSTAELVAPTISAGEIDGDSTAGRSILSCVCPDALSGFVAASASAASIALRFSIAYILGLAVHQSVTMFGLPIGYQSLGATARSAILSGEVPAYPGVSRTANNFEMHRSRPAARSLPRALSTISPAARRHAE